MKNESFDSYYDINTRVDLGFQNFLTVGMTTYYASSFSLSFFLIQWCFPINERIWKPSVQPKVFSLFCAHFNQKLQQPERLQSIPRTYIGELCANYPVISAILTIKHNPFKSIPNFPKDC